MTVAKNRITRTPRRSGQGRPDFAEFGRRGKRALSESILTLRDSGPVHVLEWVNENEILRQSLRGLERLGREEVFTARTQLGVVSEVRRTTTVINLHNQLVAQLNVIGAGRSLRDYARAILDKLALAPAPWWARLRRCGYQDTALENGCARPYFWDSTDAGVMKYCTPAHAKAPRGSATASVAS